jgi:hypothetical protein
MVSLIECDACHAWTEGPLWCRSCGTPRPWLLTPEREMQLVGRLISLVEAYRRTGATRPPGKGPIPEGAITYG